MIDQATQESNLEKILLWKPVDKLTTPWASLDFAELPAPAILHSTPSSAARARREHITFYECMEGRTPHISSETPTSLPNWRGLPDERLHDRTPEPSEESSIRGLLCLC